MQTLKHDYVTCDVCGAKLNCLDYLVVPKLQSIRYFGLSTAFSEVDICKNCWREFVSYIREYKKVE